MSTAVPALAANALTTIPAVREELCVEITRDTQARIVRSINRASGIIEAQCNRSFARAVVTNEAHGGFGTTKLVVDRPPVTTLTNIKLRGDVVDSDRTRIFDAEAGIVQLENGFGWTTHNARDISTGRLADEELKDFTVDYTGGFVLPKDDGAAGAPISGDPRDLPVDLEEACIELAIDLFHNLGRNKAVKSEKMLSWGATYVESGFPPLTRAAITRHMVRS